jgi:hypothetical protein
MDNCLKIYGSGAIIMMALFLRKNILSLVCILVFLSLSFHALAVQISRPDGTIYQAVDWKPGRGTV